jgi:hypothetical protein
MWWLIVDDAEIALLSQPGMVAVVDLHYVIEGNTHDIPIP